MKKIYLFLLLICNLDAKSQACPELLTVLINSCPSGATAEVAANEWFTFNTGGSPLIVNDFTFQYGTPPAFTTFQLLAGTATYVAQPATVTLSGCAVINVITSGGTIPANSKVLVMSSATSLTNINVNSVCTGGVAYVMFYNPATASGNNTGGNFANAPATARGFKIFNTTAPCGFTTATGYTYVNGWAGNTDGNGVNFTPPNSQTSPSYNNSGCTGGTVLPVTLTSFTTSFSNNTVTLNWQTETENNSSYFAVERSYNGIDFEVIGKVSAAGNSNTIQQYRFTETNPRKTTAYYRLQIVDHDGGAVFSNVSKINTGEAALAIRTLYPQPAKHELVVEWNSNAATATRIDVRDMTGRLIQSVSPGSNAGFNQYKLNTAALAAGQYILQLVTETGTQTEKFLKQQ